jgi:phosphoserine phosphatase RsbU/P
MAIIRMLKGQGTRRAFFLVADQTGHIGDLRIGRDKQQSNFVLIPRSVSRAHARIYFQDGAFYIEDLESKAGTVLNGRRLSPHVPRELKHRDLINICDHIFEFTDVDEDEGSSGTCTVPIAVSRDHDHSDYSLSLDSNATSVASRTSSNAAMKLAAFMKLTQDLRSTVALDRLLEKALESLLQMFAMARRGIILLQGDQASILPRSMVRFRNRQEGQRASLNGSIVNTVMSTGKAVRAEDGMTMCVPILNRREEPLGIIQLDADHLEGPFQADRLDLFLTAALQVSFTVENAILHEAALRKRALEWELEIAQEIQISLLPSERPEIPGYEFWDYYAPAKQVGGDYFDYRELRNNRLAVLLGDVSGKGVPAALLMARASVDFSAFLPNEMSPVEVVNTVNRRFVQRSAETGFMTMVLVLLDWVTHRLQLVNAGHVRPLLRRTTGEVLEVGAVESGLPLGILPNVEYRQAELDMGPGETLLLVTDGIIEAQNGQGALYGTARLREVYASCGGSAFDIAQSILDDMGRFVADNEQIDDSCLVVLRRGEFTECSHAALNPKRSNEKYVDTVELLKEITGKESSPPEVPPTPRGGGFLGAALYDSGFGSRADAVMDTLMSTSRPNKSEYWLGVLESLARFVFSAKSIDDFVMHALDEMFVRLPELDRGNVFLLDRRGKLTLRWAKVRWPTDVLRSQCVHLSKWLAENHIHIPMALESGFQHEILNENPVVRLQLGRGFHQFLVLDAVEGLEDSGAFDLNRFLQYAVRKMNLTFGLSVDTSEYHPEDLAQILKDEDRSLICLANSGIVPDQEIGRLRILTQERHRALFCGYRKFGRSVIELASDDVRLFEFDRVVAQNALQHDQGLLCNDPCALPLTRERQAVRGQRLMCAPFHDLEGKPLGIVQVYGRNRHAQFDNDDLSVLRLVAVELSIAMDSINQRQSKI